MSTAAHDPVAMVVIAAFRTKPLESVTESDSATSDLLATL
jgi:hypothetical protein